ncbi:MAG: PorV/PorQ family protein, partial [Ignavibacteria bacterium]|nr:PorV/PorQ family protein [Ignavibacteria bacterium]
GVALNGAYTSGISGIEAIYYNPAGLGVTGNSAEAMFSHMSHIADIGVSYAAVSANFEGFGSLAFSIKSIDFGDIPVTTIENPQGTGATFSPNYVTFGVTYANYLTDRIRVGVNVNVVSEKIVRTSATGVAFDAGVQYNGVAGVEGLKLGVVLKNFGPSMKFSGPDLIRTANDASSLRGNQYYMIDAATFELPSQLILGVAYEQKFAGVYKATISTSFNNNNFANDEYKFAGELSFRDMFYLRGGYSFYASTTANIEDDEQNIYGATFGAGVNVNAGLDLTFDYAYRSVRYFDPNHVFTIKLGF